MIRWHSDFHCSWVLSPAGVVTFCGVDGCVFVSGAHEIDGGNDLGDLSTCWKTPAKDFRRTKSNFMVEFPRFHEPGRFVAPLSSRSQESCWKPRSGFGVA